MSKAEVVIDSEESLRAAELLYEGIVAEVQDIQSQLGNKNQGGDSRLSAKQYWEWRNRAVFAMRHLLEEQRTLKGAIKDYNRQAERARVSAVIDITNPEGLLKAAYTLLRRLASQVDFDQDEQLVVNALDLHLRTKGK